MQKKWQDKLIVACPNSKGQNIKRDFDLTKLATVVMTTTKRCKTIAFDHEQLFKDQGIRLVAKEKKTNEDSQGTDSIILNKKILYFFKEIKIKKGKGKGGKRI